MTNLQTWIMVGSLTGNVVLFRWWRIACNRANSDHR